MPAPKRTRDELPSNELILAAIDRAERHRYKPENGGLLLSSIKAHLGLPHNSWTTRLLRPQLEAFESAGLVEAFESAGLVEQLRRHGLVLWTLTDSGRRQVEAARETSEPPQLPEAPQHRRWREAQAAAGQRITELREDLRGTLDEGTHLLDADAISSGAWFELGERLQHAAVSLASATYCLHEWGEPDDSRADIDTPPYGQSARREARAWSRSGRGSQLDSSSE